MACETCPDPGAADASENARYCEGPTTLRFRDHGSCVRVGVCAAQLADIVIDRKEGVHPAWVDYTVVAQAQVFEARA